MTCDLQKKPVGCHGVSSATLPQRALRDIPLGPVLANIFTCSFKRTWVFNNSALPSIDMLMTLSPYLTIRTNKKTALQFLRYLNSRHQNIKFPIEFEHNQEIPFRNVLVKRHPNNSFSTYNIHRKKTFTVLYTQWISFTPRKS